ncbi:hypothetical protein RYH80_19085 [Halobaculum sp. MBLA0147]|uniref:hypothetical protein n=1 Tax=Halobaculum sp. MBLA0147 TaxID=3079934 RepID=UPI003524E2CF
MRNAVAIGMVLLGVVTVGGAAMADLGAPSGDAILDDAAATYESADTVVGEATVTVDNGTTNRTTTVSYAVATNNRTRLTTTTENRTIVVGTNGSVAWIHDESSGVTRVVENRSELRALMNQTAGEDWRERVQENTTERQSQMSKAAPSDRVNWHNRTGMQPTAGAWNESNRTADRVGQTTVRDTQAWIVEVSSTNDEVDTTVTNWVSVESDLLLRQRIVSDNDTVTIDYTETRLNVSVSNETFQPPSDARDQPGAASAVDYDSFKSLQSATEATVPELSGESYTFAGGSVVSFGGETAIAQYTGPANVSVVATTADELPTSDRDVENTTVAGESVRVTETDSRTIVAWRSDDGQTVGIATDGGRDLAERLAKRLLS